MQLFGRSKPKPKPVANPEDVTQRLSNQLEILKKKQKFLEAKSANELLHIRQIASKDRKGLFLHSSRIESLAELTIEPLCCTM